ncbi:hypothetical protein [Ahrensia sp. R2A130]|uniref:hypothetical protein n=1 Tax=Ahrensia sp. R2A130 TaxID=744979 RepID=UPI0001E0A483|nr:hypothetical protein [Ahrensia sp. R2A130]EFL88610.1 ABC-3 protein [Ahrensia sp. R2A130]
MAHTKALLLRNRECIDESSGQISGIDRVARAFLSLKSSERLAVTILAVLGLFALCGLAASVAHGFSMPVATGALGVLLGAPGIALSFFDRNATSDCDES